MEIISKNTSLNVQQCWGTKCFCNQRIVYYEKLISKIHRYKFFSIVATCFSAFREVMNPNLCKWDVNILICRTYQAVVCTVCHAVCDWVTECVWGFVTYLLFHIGDLCRWHVVHWLVYLVGGTVACKRFPSNSFEGLCDMVLIVLRFPLRFQSHVCYLVFAVHKKWHEASFILRTHTY